MLKLKTKAVIIPFFLMALTIFVPIVLLSLILASGSSTPLTLGRILLIVTTFFLVLFPAGFCLTWVVGVQRFLSDNPVVRIIWYLITGWGLYLIIWFVMGFITINPYAIVILQSSFILISSWIIIRRINQEEKKERSWKIFASDFVNYDNLFMLSLFVFSILYFGFTMSQMEWAPPGDADTHGMIIALLLANRQFPLSYLPIANIPYNPVTYPHGFHAIGAVLCINTFIYPGQASLILAGCASVLIPLLLSSVVYLLTRNRIAVLVTFVLSFFVPPSTPLNLGDPTLNFISMFRMVWGRGHDLLMANLINGTYPNHIGTLFLLATILFPILVLKDSRATLTKPGKWFLIPLLIGIATVLTYYTYAIFVGIYFGVWILILLFKLIKDVRNQTLNPIVKKRRKLEFWFFTGIIIFLLIGFFTIYPFLTNLINNYYMPASNFLTSLQFFLSINGILAGTCFVLFVALIMKKHELIAALSFMFVYVLLAFSTFYLLFSTLLWAVPTIRAQPVLAGLTYCLLPIALISFNKIYTKISLFSIPTTLSQDTLRKTLTAFLLFFLILLVAPSHILSQPSNSFRPAGEDFQAIQFLLNISEPDDLILNDRTWEGWSILSFRAQSVVFSRYTQFIMFNREMYTETIEYERIVDCWNLFNEPSNSVIVEYVFNKYDIKYVYIGSTRRFVVWIPGGYYYANSSLFNPNIFNHKWYLEVFDNYTQPGPNHYFVELFHTENTRVYEVIWPP